MFIYHGLILLFILSGLCLGIASFRTWKDHVKTKRLLRNKGVSGEKFCGELLDRFGGSNRLDQVVIGDAYSGKSIEIDCIVFCGTHVTVVEAKSWSGVISGGINDQIWEITLPNGRKVTRKNPVMQVYSQASVISNAFSIPKNRIQCAVVMVGDATFDDDGIKNSNGIIFTKKNIPAIRNLMQPWKASDAAIQSYVESRWNACVSYVFSHHHDIWKRLHSDIIRAYNNHVPAWVFIGAFGFCVTLVGVTACNLSLTP